MFSHEREWLKGVKPSQENNIKKVFLYEEDRFSFREVSSLWELGRVTRLCVGMASFEGFIT